MKKAIDALLKFVAEGDQEKSDKALFLKYAKNTDTILTRDSELFHFTASAFVVNEDKTKVVSAHHNIFGSWCWLGGHTDGDEDFLHVAKKEVEEESGIKNVKLYGDGIFSLETLPVLGHTKRGKHVPAHTHLNVTYVFIASEKENLQICEGENRDIAWLDIQDIIVTSEEKYMRPIYKKIINKIHRLEKEADNQK